MTVASIKGRHQNDEEEPAAKRGVEKKEYVKRWRGLQFFLRFEYHKVTRTQRNPALPPGPAPQQAQGGPVVEARVVHLDDQGDPGTDTTETTTKSGMVACGVMPPPKSIGQDPAVE